MKTETIGHAYMISCMFMPFLIPMTVAMLMMTGR